MDKQPLKAQKTQAPPTKKPTPPADDVISNQPTANKTAPHPVVREPVITGTSVPGPVRTIIEKLIYAAGGLIALLLLARLVLTLIGLGRDNLFAGTIYDVSAIFVGPFLSWFGYEPIYGTSALELGTIVAIVLYLVATVLLAKLVTFSRHRTFIP